MNKKCKYQLIKMENEHLEQHLRLLELLTNKNKTKKDNNVVMNYIVMVTLMNVVCNISRKYKTLLPESIKHPGVQNTCN